MDPILEEAFTARLGADTFTIEVVHRLNTAVFPRAGVEFYCRDGRVYAITPEPENALVSVADLRVLKGMPDAEVVAFVQRVVAAYRKRTHSKRPLSALRLQAGFLSQEEQAGFINARYDSPPAKPVISPKTIWNAEHGRPISERSAFLIIAALKERGVLAESEDLDWVIGQQGKRKQARKAPESGMLEEGLRAE
jgi:hypothetical protein